MNEQMTGYPSIDKPWLKYYGDEVSGLQVPSKTAYEYMWENNKNNENEVAIRFYWKKISYKALFKKIEKVANSFAKLDIKRNDVVAICAVTTPETIYAFYALNYIGATANIIDPRTNIDRIIDYLRKSKTKCIVAIDKCEAIVDKILGENICESAVIFSPTNTLNPLNKVNINGHSNKYNKFEWNQFIKLGKEKIVERAMRLVRKKHHKFQIGLGHTTKSIDFIIMEVLGTEWAEKIIEKVLDRMNEVNICTEYVRILKLAYLSPEVKNSEIIMDELNLSKSTYYRKKEQAVTLFGILLWTTMLEECGCCVGKEAAKSC